MTYNPTDEGRELVKMLSASGMTQEQVSAVVGVSVETMLKYYRHEYDHGNELMIGDLIPVCMQVAKDLDHKDSSKERHFLLERKGGFVKTEKREVEGGLKIAYLDKEDEQA